MDPLIQVPVAQRRVSAVLFADLVDSVGLIRRDAEGTIQRWRTFIAGVTHEELPRRQGRIVKVTGDGMLVEYPAVGNALSCALAMQDRLAGTNADLATELRLRLRIGLNLTDVIADELDLYGEGVNLAARLMSLGEPGDIVMSTRARDEVTDGLGVQIEDLGERSVKGLDSPVRAYRAWPPGREPAPSFARRARAGERPSIAVLPFRNVSGREEDEYIGDMIAEDLIGQFSRSTDLVVISRLSTTPFRNRLYEPRNVAELLGVRYILSGTLQSAGDRLRLAAELTESEAGSVIWAERFEGERSAIFELQDRLSEDISRRVVPYVRQIELERARAKRPENLTAYERTLRAIDHMHRNSPDDLRLSRELLESAIGSDPHYAAPHAWLALSHVRAVGQGWSTDVAHDTQQANRYADAAMSRDDTSSRVLAIYGLVTAYLNKDLDEGIAYYDRALTINPSEASAWMWSSAAHAWKGHGEEAVQRAPRAIEISPFDPNMYSFTAMAGTAYMVAGRYDEAINCVRQSLRQNRMFVTAHRALVISLELAGYSDEARAAAVQLLQLEPNLTVGGFIERYPGRSSPQAVEFAAALARAGVPR
ncbi:MAG TPA: adenylate/guanylate cyclase domain-containing protein [Casimicrobiaceae bacterium]|nr:adenylate/guanylate cyclase domain-containing protein [Casimicrobiaceae bacterium]